MPDISTEKQYYVSSKNRTIALLLTCVGFFGVAGLQRLYVGKTVSGILYLLTCGGFLLGSIYDLYSIYNETFTDCDGFPLFADSSLKSNYHRRTPHKSVNYFALGFVAIWIIMLCCSIFATVMLHKEEQAKFYEAANSAYEEIKESYSKEDYDSVKTKLDDMEIKYASTPAYSKAISEFGDYKEKKKKLEKEKAAKKKEADNKAYEEWLEKAKVEWDKNGQEFVNEYTELLSGISGAKEIFYNASSNGIAVTIYVNRNWYYLHKEEKKDFIKRAVVLWIGKLRGTRLMPSWHEFTPDFSFINEMSGRTVATWKKSWGPSIKE